MTETPRIAIVPGDPTGGAQPLKPPMRLAFLQGDDGQGGVIAPDHCRNPVEPPHAAIRKRLLDLPRPRDPLVLRWGR